MKSFIKDYSETKEYIVSLHRTDDLEDFYKDIENFGHSNECVPERKVACCSKRLSSRNTHYMLTWWEAEDLKNDPRVKSVTLHPKYLGITAGEFLTTTQTSSNWNKSSTTSNNHLNWGLLRCFEGVDRSSWGSNGVSNQSGTISLSSTGKNVDVVIIDGDGVVLNHPEYAVNADGTGGTRFVQYNWYQHDPAVKGTSPGTYSYSNVSGHATHVSGTAAGSTQGWARSANIYNIYYFAGDNGNANFPYVMDYVREFHRTKSINPQTGRKNPTITNNSWGQSIFPQQWSFSDITAVTYRGVRYTPSGETIYTGLSGVYTSSTKIEDLLGFENFGNRITTSGAYDPPGGDILSFPEDWILEGNQVYYTVLSAPNSNSYIVEVDGPASLSLINEIAGESFAGTITLYTEIVIKEGETTLETFTSGPFTSIDGGSVEASIRENYEYLGNETLTIEFNSSVNTSQSVNPIVITAMSLTVASDEEELPTATVTEIANILLGAASLTPSTTPTSGGNDDGFWELILPFNISYLGNSYDRVYVGTNGYLTFTGGASVYSNLGPGTPNLPKIMIGADDRSVQRIYYGSELATENVSYQVSNSGASSYIIDESNNPTLNLTRGSTYTFNINSTGHPFWIKTSPVTGTGDAYSTGITGNGTENGTLTFTVPIDAPATLYYICQFHSSMTGTINITDASQKYRIRVEGHTSFSGGVLGSPTVVYEYSFYENLPNQIDLQIGINNAKSSGGGFTNEQLNNWGFISGQRIPARVSSLDIDIEDAIQEGIIYVGAAGNGKWKHDIPGGIDWDNTFEMGVRYPDSVNNPYYYMRGSSPTANDNAAEGEFEIPNICVGSIDVSVGDFKATYSDCGPGVDIFAPGTNIISSYNSGVSDSRNGSFLLGKISGTSMASPQVCGVLACALEQNPHWNQIQAKAYITGIAKLGQMSTSSGGPTDERDLQGAPNKYLFYKKERPSSGLTVPKNSPGPRPSSGLAYPRPKIYRSR
jgi:plastocyanin